MKAVYKGCSDEQVAFSGYDDPRLSLREGREYEVEDVYIHSWHTEIKLVGIEGRFNSVCFEFDGDIFAEGEMQ